MNEQQSSNPTPPVSAPAAAKFRGDKDANSLAAQATERNKKRRRQRQQELQPTQAPVTAVPLTTASASFGEPAGLANDPEAVTASPANLGTARPTGHLKAGVTPTEPPL
jgi:hypothetical protein